MNIRLTLHPAPATDTRHDALQAELIAWSLAYASNGYTVFPVNPRDKRPLVKWKAGATTDPELIAAFWQRWPLALIAMPTGARTGFNVLDVDMKDGVDGFDTLRRLRITIPANVVEVRTPSGGSHFYLDYEPGYTTNASKIGPGVDVRTDGGLIILPPSRRCLDCGDYHFAEGQEISMGRLTQ